MSEEIDAAKIAALVDVLKTAMPRLVVEAVNALKPELPKLVPNLSDEEWETLKRDEAGRGRKVMSRLTWVKTPAPLPPPIHWWASSPDCVRYEAKIGDGNPPYCIRERTIRGKTFFIVSHGKQHRAILRSIEKAKAFAEANYEASAGGAR